MIKVKIGSFKDELINCDYDLHLIDAKDLSDNLKAYYKSKDIDYNAFNSDLKEAYSHDLKEMEEFSKNPHKEIYEYQNFFLMENDNHDYILLDGFRRLLWYDAPSTPVFVRIYKQKDLSNQSILTLLVYLNH